MRLAILLVNYNSSADLIAVVNQLEREVCYPKNCRKKIFILENGSPKEGEKEALENLRTFKDVCLYFSPRNLGFAGGNNFLLKKAKEEGFDYYLFLNPDTIISPNFLLELLKPFSSQSSSSRNGLPSGSIGLASPKIYFAPGYETHCQRYKKSEIGRVIWYGGGVLDWDNIIGFHRDVDKVDANRGQRSKLPVCVPTDFCTGCCLLATKQAIDKLGGFDEVYFLNWEDADLSVRARETGLQTVYVPKSVIWHKNAVSKGGMGSKVEDFWQTRNRLIFAFKYAPLKTRILLLIHLLKTANLNRLRAVGAGIWVLVRQVAIKNADHPLLLRGAFFLF